jgi:hypothetical protein
VKVTIDPAVLAKVAQLAGIKDFPVTGSLLEISGLKNYQKELDQPLIELMGQLGVFQTTSREQFERHIQTSIKCAHDRAALRNATKLKTATVARLAHQLKEALKTSPPALSHYLQSFGLPSTDQYVVTIGDLAEAAQRINRNKKEARLVEAAQRINRNKKNKKKVTVLARRPGKWAEWDRRVFVEELLDAAQAAGGRLGVNSDNNRGSLVEVLDLLRRHLPADFEKGLSAKTLRRIITAKNREQGQKSKTKLNKR